jgi:hypothetical protein
MSRLKLGNVCYNLAQTLSLPVCYTKIKRLEYTKLQFCLLFCMGVKLGVLSWGRNIDRLMTFENRVLRRIFGPARDEVTRKWRWLHNEDLYDLYWSPNIIKVINSRLRWAGYVTHTGEGQVHTGYWWGDLKERDDLEGLGVDGRIILKWIFMWNGWAWTGLIWLKTRKVGGLLWMQ